MQAKISQGLGFRMSVDGDYAALVFKFVTHAIDEPLATSF
jgi:hypothetical protein